MKFLKMETYSWVEKDNYSFEFITDARLLALILQNRTGFYGA